MAPLHPSAIPNALSHGASGPSGARTDPAGIARTAWRIRPTDSRASSTRIRERACTSPESRTGTRKFNRS